jgi:hypothetical protein
MHAVVGLAETLDLELKQVSTALGGTATPQATSGTNSV